MDNRSSELSRLPTKIWIQNQRYDEPQIDPKQPKEEKLDVRISAEEPRVVAVEVNLMADRLHPEPQTQLTHFGNTDAVLQEGMRAVAVTNDKLASSLARINLPKTLTLINSPATPPCSTRGKVRSKVCYVIVTLEMNYLHIYTARNELSSYVHKGWSAEIGEQFPQEAIPQYVSGAEGTMDHT